MEEEIRNLRKDLAKFVDWAKQSHEFNQRNLSIINENFNLLLKLFVSKNETVTLENLRCTSMTSKGGDEVECENSEETSSSVSFETFADFSDDEDVEESLRIKPISLKMLPLNTKKSTKITLNKKRKSKLTEKLNSVTDETTETIGKSNGENTKLDINLTDGNGRKGRPSKVIYTGKKFDQHLKDLKRRVDDISKRFPRCIKLPDSYLEYGAARGWKIKQIRMKFYCDRMNTARRMPKVNVTKKRTCLKNRIVNKRVYTGRNVTPELNLSPEQLEANFKALREDYSKKCRKPHPIPNFYFEFGAARGWDWKQVSKKYYTQTLKGK